MHRLCQYLLVAGAAGAILATALPDAEAARKASLAENRLVLDKNDVYFFPQVATEYTNLASFEYGIIGNSGSGLVLLGDESMAFGFGIARGDAFGTQHHFPHDLNGGLGGLGGLSTQNLGNIENILGDPFEDLTGFGLVPQPHTVVDLFGAMDVGGGLLGGRLTLANGGDRETNIEDETSGTSQTLVGLTVGYSMIDDLRVDIGGRFEFGSMTDFDDDETEFDGGYLSAGVSARGYSPMAEDVDLGLLGDLYFTNRRYTAYGDDDLDIDDLTVNISEFSAFGGVGPVYNIDQTTLAGYAVLGYVRDSVDEDVDDDDILQVMSNGIVPGIHFAADIEIFEWLYFRTGMQYNFGVVATTTAVDTEGIDDAERDDVTESERYSGFGWRTGIGVEVNNFTVDGVFQQGFVTGGPDFLGGTGGGLFTMVSAGYNF